MSKIKKILKEYSGMDFCGKEDCNNYALYLKAEAAITELIRDARVDAIASYNKVNNLLEDEEIRKEAETKQLEEIILAGWDDMHGSFDYNLIAEKVMELSAKRIKK